MSTIFTASGGHILAEVSIDPACIGGAGFAEMPMLTASLQMLLRSHKQLNATFHFREMLCRLSACNSGYVAFSLPTPINVRIGPGKELPNHVIYLEIPLDQRRIATINRLRKGGDVDLQFHLELVADELVELRLAANAPSAFGLRDQHRMRAQVNVQIPRSRWAEYVLSQLQFGKVHVIELPVVPIEKCAEMSAAFSALQQAYKLEGQGFYIEAVAACRKALEPFFDRVTANDGKKSFALKASWETRLGKATYDWLNASLIAAKQATDGSHHISSTSFDQTETQMLLAIATSLVAYAVKTRPDTSSQSKHFRVLAVSLSSRGFGYAVLQGDKWLIDYGNKRIDENKNARVLGHVERIIATKQPDVMVLRDVNTKDARRDPRIKQLHRKIIALTRKRKLATIKISGTEVRRLLLGNEAGTKQEMAEKLAEEFPEELASRLPPKRRPWTSEDARMDIFDAAGLAVAFRTR